eukprot:TRINITY_DN25180_c0_g1_i1.p2 TRINITY_DN25180_c0_g1~~TRINITY_DN25180_c0_g1_i1.p2  ORF type:complete len:102 (+),score=7.95 TRINITY_DN25180_c0_g1_i1:465-770(+)
MFALDGTRLSQFRLADDRTERMVVSRDGLIAVSSCCYRQGTQSLQVSVYASNGVLLQMFDLGRAQQFSVAWTDTHLVCTQDADVFAINLHGVQPFRPRATR